MSDLISREEATAVFKKHQSHMATHLWEYEQDMNAIPSADIMECAREIKEYCKKYDEHCVGCPFNSAKPTKWCELGSSSLPYEWDLPEGDKE